jgi:hypothetical protein
MPRRKKSTKSKKKDSGISINIKNIMRQVQNERPRTDFIMPHKNDPRYNLNNGRMRTMFAPPVTYMTTPLNAFPSLQSIQDIRAPPNRAPQQLGSQSSKPVNQAGGPVIGPEQDINNNMFDQSRISKLGAPAGKQKFPVTPGPVRDVSSPTVHAIADRPESLLSPGQGGIPLAEYDTDERDMLDESEELIADAIPMSHSADALGLFPRAQASANPFLVAPGIYPLQGRDTPGRGRPKKEPGSGKSKYVRKPKADEEDEKD